MRFLFHDSSHLTRGINSHVQALSKKARQVNLTHTQLTEITPFIIKYTGIDHPQRRSWDVLTCSNIGNRAILVENVDDTSSVSYMHTLESGQMRDAEANGVSLTELTATSTMRKLDVVRAKTSLAEPERVGVDRYWPPGFGAAAEF